VVFFFWGCGGGGEKIDLIHFQNLSNAYCLLTYGKQKIENRDGVFILGVRL